jgi:hypothetical protein
MNQVKPKSDFQNPVSAAVLTGADAQLLHSALVKGEQAIARQKDMIEMHKRFVAMFTTLNTGLGEQQSRKAAEDRAVLVEKLESMEHAVNGMEGVLRIEMAPQLERMLDDALDRREPKQNPRRFRVFWVILALIVGLAIGTLYSEKIEETSFQAMGRIGWNF